MELENAQLIKKWEELHLEAYLPTPKDVWTIGWGHTHGVKKGDSISHDEAEAYFLLDSLWVSEAIKELVKVPLNQHQYDALSSWTFNLGRTNLKSSTLLRKLNAGDYEGAAQEFPRWIYQDGEVLGGLVSRRAEEMAYFLKADGITTGSLSVDRVEPLPPLVLSKEIMAGSASIVGAVGALLGKLNDTSQTISVITIAGILTVVGLFVIWNRVQARRKGER